MTISAASALVIAKDLSGVLGSKRRDLQVRISPAVSVDRKATPSRQADQVAVRTVSLDYVRVRRGGSKSTSLQRSLTISPTRQPGQDQQPKSGDREGRLPLRLLGLRQQGREPGERLTLLFDANSSGKSSILQALIYQHELIERGSADIDRTELGGTP